MTQTVVIVVKHVKKILNVNFSSHSPGPAFLDGTTDSNGWFVFRISDE